MTGINRVHMIVFLHAGDVVYDKSLGMPEIIDPG